MNIQVHSSTGSSPYELVFGQKPRAVLFPNNSDDVDVVFEEDLERDGVVIDDDNDVTCQRQAYSFSTQSPSRRTLSDSATPCTPVYRVPRQSMSLSPTHQHRGYFVHLSRCSHPPPLPYVRPVLSHPNVHLGRCSWPLPLLYVRPLIQSPSLSHPNIRLDKCSRLDRCSRPPPLLYVRPLVQNLSLSPHLLYVLLRPSIYLRPRLHLPHQLHLPHVMTVWLQLKNIFVWVCMCWAWSILHVGFPSIINCLWDAYWHSCNILQVRLRANQKYLKTAERMAHRYNSNRKTLVFSVGDVVSLRIPQIDRTSSDQPRLPCVVVEVKGKAQNLYRLRYLPYLWHIN